MRRFVKAYHSTHPLFEKGIRRIGLLPTKIAFPNYFNMSIIPELNRVIDRFRPKDMHVKRSDCVFFRVERPSGSAATVVEAEIDAKKAIVGDDAIVSQVYDALLGGRIKDPLKDERIAQAGKDYWKGCVPLDYFLSHYKKTPRGWVKKKGATGKGPILILKPEVLYPFSVKNIYISK